jgi:hypothetical protein
MLPATILSGLTVTYFDSKVIVCYFILRTVSIAINIIAIFAIFIKLYYMNDGTELKNNPVFVLSMRLVYYCVVQTITRLSSTWYQLQYGFGSADKYEADKSTSLETAIYLSEFIFSPAAGIGYLLVFLHIQPDALDELRLILSPRYYSKKGSGEESVLSSSSHGDSQTDGNSSSAYTLSNSLSRASARESLLGGEVEDEDTPRSSSTRESLFPLLDMDEDDLAREIDRRYNPNHSQRSLLSDKW